MSVEDIGRNGPCLCGSGRKYKICCLGRTEPLAPSGRGLDAFADMRQATERREFASIAEAQAFARNFSEQRNRTPIDDFQGLSPEQMYRFLHFPFDSPQLVTFSSCLARQHGGSGPTRLSIRF